MPHCKLQHTSTPHPQDQAAGGLRSARYSGDNRLLPPQFTVTVPCFVSPEEREQENTLNDFW